MGPTVDLKPMMLDAGILVLHIEYEVRAVEHRSSFE